MSKVVVTEVQSESGSGGAPEWRFIVERVPEQVFTACHPDPRDVPQDVRDWLRAWLDGAGA